MNDEVFSNQGESQESLDGRVEEARLKLEALQVAYDQLMKKLLAEGRRSEEQINLRLEKALAEVENKKRVAEEAGHQCGYDAGHREGVETGTSQGLQKGLEESRRQFDQEVVAKASKIAEESCGSLPSLLQQAMVEFEKCRQSTIEETRRDTVKLARGIAERVLRREIEDLPLVVVENIELAVQRISDRCQVVIEVHPDDLTAVIQFLPSLAQKFEGAEGAEVVGIDSITRGGCRVKSRSSSVDLTIGTQLDLIESTLIKDTQESG